MTITVTVPDGFTTPPQNQGQIVDVSYGIGCLQIGDPWCIVVRTFDSSDRSESFEAYDFHADGAGSWDPWNGAPELGDSLGPSEVTR